MHRDESTFGCECQRNAASDATTGTGHQGNLALQIT
jgi:hypothetical protein